MARKLGPGARARLGRLAAVVLALSGAATRAGAQTDYTNTDRGRPLRIEDAYPTVHHAIELKLAPLTLERESGSFDLTITPELAYGLSPHTHVSISLPVLLNDMEDSHLGDMALGGIDLSVLHNLAGETKRLPAFAVRGDLWIPAGGLSPDKVHPSLTGLATRTVGVIRLHLNAQYTFVGEDDTNASELSRWLVGLAADHSFKRYRMLVTADVFANEPLGEDAALNAEAGVRHQLGSRLALDASFSAAWGGDDSNWAVNIGGAYALRKGGR